MLVACVVVAVAVAAVVVVVVVAVFHSVSLFDFSHTDQSSAASQHRSASMNTCSTERMFEC